MPVSEAVSPTIPSAQSIEDDADRALVAGVQRGEQDAFYQLVERYQNRVFNLAYRILGDSYAAEDAAQEAFLRAYTRIASYDPRYAFRSWLFTITSNYCIDVIRRRKLKLLSLDEPEPSPTIAALADTTPQPEEHTIRAQQSEQIQALLASLAEKDRVMVVLFYWYDYSYEEIARVTESTASAVKSRLHRARALIAQRMHNISSEARPHSTHFAVSAKKG